MNMDLMIDYIPYSSFDDKLCEMLEDDLKFFTNLNPSSSSSPSCLSDEEQLAASNFFDDFLFSSQQLQSNQNLNLDPLSSSLNTLDETYNSIINSNSFNTLQYSFQSSSSSPMSSASISAASSSAPSPLSLSASSSSLNAALASTNFQSTSTSPNCSSQSSPICLSPNQFNNYQLDEFNINSHNQNQTKFIQDTFSNNNYNLYPVVNPMDINRNYAIENPSNSQSQVLNAKTLSINSAQLPTLVSANRPTPQMSLNKTTFNSNINNNINTNQQTKRCKFTHNQPNSNYNMIKQEQIINSDGESIHSNESDSNSNFSSASTNAVNAANTNFSINNNQEYQPKKVIITTKIEPLSYHINAPTTQTNSTNQSNTNSSIILNNPQISLIKIPKENLDNKGGLQIPINLSLTKNENSQNTKTIIQYKQFINGANNTNTNTIKQIKNRQNSVTASNSNNNQNGAVAQVALRSDGKAYPKPPYSYSCLIAMALRNSDSGTLPVSDIYEFIIENFPYYKTARDGWKNSIRHNLSLNKCFEKIENPTNGSKKGCLWALNPDKCKKLEEECKRCRQRDPVNIRLSMSRPDDLNKIERGEQRIKKYTTQRKLMENQQINSPSSNINNTQTTQQSTQQSNQFNDKNFLAEWKNPTIKEEEQDFEELGNTDIKIDPDLFSRVTQTIRTNIQ